jgi:hypothetical protein
MPGVGLILRLNLVEDAMGFSNYMPKGLLN